MRLTSVNPLLSTDQRSTDGQSTAYQYQFIWLFTLFCNVRGSLLIYVFIFCIYFYRRRQQPQFFMHVSSFIFGPTRSRLKAAINSCNKDTYPRTPTQKQQKCKTNKAHWKKRELIAFYVLQQLATLFYGWVVYKYLRDRISVDSPNSGKNTKNSTLRFLRIQWSFANGFWGLTSFLLMV